MWFSQVRCSWIKILVGPEQTPIKLNHQQNMLIQERLFSLSFHNSFIHIINKKPWIHLIKSLKTIVIVKSSDCIALFIFKILPGKCLYFTKVKDPAVINNQRRVKTERYLNTSRQTLIITCHQILISSHCSLGKEIQTKHRLLSHTTDV